MTQWPRGLVEYTPSGIADATPDPEEDRLLQRANLAGRLLTLLAGQGRRVDAEVEELRAIDALRQAGDRSAATARLDRLLAAIDAASSGLPPP